MMVIPEYQVKEKLYESYNSYIYRVSHEETKLHVIIKVLKGEYPNPERIARFKREYEILKGINLEGVIKAHSLERYNNSYAFIMEDFHADSIKNILEKRELNLNEFFKLSIKITEILGQLHQLNIIHKNINPANIVWNQETDQVKIIDFGISTVLSQEIAAIQNPYEMEGTLNYISPEQTGRMNRMIDYRTDMYSLGVTLYEIVTGQLPFPARDAMDLVHCHLAKNPPAPHLFKSRLLTEGSKGQEILSKIILKLMSKTAEDRYLSYFGLKYDLEKCLKHLKKNQTLSGLHFNPGENDFSNRFHIPQKLYGRETEIAILLEAFQKVCGRPREAAVSEMMIVTGYGGIGKSALVNEIHIPIVEKRGYFISGKFDRLKRNIPYSALTQAFQDLIRQILIESESQIKQWKTKILDAVGPNGQVIIDVIPEIELIIGKQPAVPELSPQDTQNRFNTYFQNFIRTFASESHPLSIFLDDLQWTDIPTLKLLERLMLDSRTRYMFIIGVYVDNEVDPSHPLIISLNKIKNGGAIINYITLLPLEARHINQLISDSLRCNITDVEYLGKLCLAKTNGNPFFLIQFLNSLFDLGLIEFDTKTFKWKWDAAKIERTDITSNVVELMLVKIRKLSENTKRILKLASCIGNRFDLDTLSIINEKPAVEIANEMNEALESGLIQPIGEGYKLAGYLDFLKDDNSFDRLEHKIQYKFLHDRVHQAAYSLISDEYRQIHYKIGRLLLQKFVKVEREERIFDIANHLNLGIDLIVDKTEKNELSELNLLAGRKAKAATAYEIAFQYFNTGLELLGTNGWKDNYALTLEMNIETAETSYLTGNFEKMDKLAGEISNHAETLLDNIRINEIVIESYLARGRLKESIATAVKILKQLGVHITPEPGKFNVLLNLSYLRLILSATKIEDLKNLPVMTDVHKLAAMRILMKAASSAYYTNILVAISMAFKMVYLSIRYGNSPFSSFGYALYGIILQGIVGKIILGYKFGEFSIELLNRFNTKEYETKINLLFNLFVKHWKDKLSETIGPLTEAFQRGLETGDYEFAAYCAAYIAIHPFHSGTRLELVEEEMRNSIEVVKKLNQELIVIVLKLSRQVVLNLTGKSNNRFLIAGESYDETKMAPRFFKDNDMADLGSLYAMKVFLCVIFDDTKGSLGVALEAEKYKQPTIGLIFLPLINFYTSLIFLSQCSGTGASGIKRYLYLSKVYFNQKRLKKWARYAPENFLHKWHLVEAERYKTHNRCLKAMNHYDKAVMLARENGYIHEEALANELAAKYYLTMGYDTIARAYIKEACYLYTIWGARAKADQLIETHHDLLYALTEERGNKNEIKSPLSGFEFSHPEKLDLATVQKASQAISGEIHLDKLLEKLMNIVIANAGAQKGFLLLNEEDGLFVEGEAIAGKEEVTVLQHVPYADQNNIALIIVNYVLRINEMVVLDNAGNLGSFKADPYITRNKPKSILCLPLFFKNKMSGILYLENNLTPSAFTSERVDVLKILTGQIVISIENARLYKSLEEYSLTLEQKVIERTQKIEYQNKEITSSIRYASRLQKALLPPDEELIRLLPSSFILSKPKDIVSGDFYWFTRKDDKIIIAVADCTGHGIPGAFMSILGISFLNEIINKAITIRANELLNQLSGQVIKSLHQTGKNVETRDGMEMGLCVFDFGKQKLQYSGASRSLYLIRDNELKEHRGDSMPIGFYEKEDQSFTNTEILFQKNDIIYLFTDGYIDQFGGIERKTFRSANFKKLLIHIHNLPLIQQKEELEKKYEEWRGDIDQVDDILIIGIKI
ncbi:MAG: AAA family ATPase [Bacteroidota bacterium]